MLARVQGISHRFSIFNSVTKKQPELVTDEENPGTTSGLNDDLEVLKDLVSFRQIRALASEEQSIEL